MVKNNGPAAAANATASDPLPSGALSFVSASQGCSFAKGTVTCQAGTLAPNATKTVTVTTKVASSDVARIDNTATAHSPTPDPNPGNNTSTVTTPVGPQADLSITKTPSTSTIGPNGQVMYTLVVTDNGPSDATGVTASDALPAGLSLVSAKPSQGSCSGTTCKLGTIVDGGQAQVLVTATASATASGAVTNTATVIGNNPDPKPGNNTGTSTITVPNPPPPPQPVSDLQIIKTVSYASAYPGQTLTYRLKVINHGPDAAKDAKVTDTASLGLKVLSAKPSQGSCKVGRPLRCSLGTIRNRKSVTITVRAKVLEAGTERNAASTTSASKEPKPSNNIDSAKTRLKPVLRLAKTASPKTVKAGGLVTYHIKVTDPTSVAIAKVRVCDALPLGLTFQGASPKAKLSAGRECWTVARLGAGKSRTFTVHARALKGTQGTKTNHATATGKGARGATSKAAVKVKPAPKPPATPVTG